jgi:hypothetical protein
MTIFRDDVRWTGLTGRGLFGSRLYPRDRSKIGGSLSIP